tara:strand:- start:253 stop:975 length:723 start_codon:yes stop_codon:yes gene_type:complete
MFFSWLKSKDSNKQNITGDPMLHAVLKTQINLNPSSNQEESFFACGCFWGAEKGFWKLPGVVTTAVGYAGGKVKDPSYNQVCSGFTGHTEIVRVLWNKETIDFSDLLKLFWECHNPTQGNRQGNDRGTQYRSAIYTTNSSQLKLANASLLAYQESLKQNGLGAITTEIKENQTFYFAEDYHQQYLAKPGSRPYCSAMPTNVKLKGFQGANFKLDNNVWDNFDWKISHCVLRSDNNPIKIE